MVKIPELLSALDHLRAALGPDALVVADHWDADPTAVGIASPRDPRVLVYLAYHADGFYVEFEAPPGPGDDGPYRTVGVRQAVRLFELPALVASHLGTFPA